MRTPGNSRYAAGQLSNPRIYRREAEGLAVSQLITDFGRTWDLTKSAKLRVQSEQMNAVATRAQILLEVNNAYYSALESQSVLHVAEETVRTRKLMQEQTAIKATNKLKSELDVMFANVDYDQAAILLAKARLTLQTSFAFLSAVLGERTPREFQLADVPLAPQQTNTYFALVFEAWQNRPDLVQLRYQRDAAREFAQAERKLDYPRVSAVAAGGVIPTGDYRLPFDYEVGGINLSVPSTPADSMPPGGGRRNCAPCGGGIGAGRGG